MQLSNLVTVLAVAASAGASPIACADNPQLECTTYKVPSTAYCRADGYVKNSAASYYKQSKFSDGVITTPEQCLQDCIAATAAGGNCKAVRWDSQWKTCYYYWQPASVFNLDSSKTSFRAFDIACKWTDKLCGQTGTKVEEGSDKPYYQDETTTSADECNKKCSVDKDCKAVKYQAAKDKCFLYKKATKDWNMTLDKTSGYAFYDRECTTCTWNTM